MGITIFKSFIWGGISSDIRSEVQVNEVLLYVCLFIFPGSLSRIES